MTHSVKMKKYLGTKLVLASPISRGGYNAYRGWEMPDNEDPNDPGYFIEYVDGGAPNHKHHVGYVTWSPADVFERSYREIGNGLTFGEALEALKIGKKVARSGWNGKGMYLYLVGPGRYPPSTPAGEAIAATQSDHLVPYAPYIAMKTAQDYVVPWLASQTDILGEDWEVVD